MIKTDIVVGDIMWNFLTKYWPKDKPDTINDPIWIIAGNRKEFEDFVIRKRMQGLHFDYRLVNHADQLRGLSRIRGFYIGTYKDRPDWSEIEEYIRIIKAKGG